MLEDQVRSLHIEMELHKRQAGSFYREKRLARKQAGKDLKDFGVITMDYGRNLPVPNISTEEIYFKKQLSFYQLYIHVLSDVAISVKPTYFGGGQNNNWTVIRFLHYVAVVLKRFDKVQFTYPIRSHSYMECDKNSALICQKTPAETP
ncbi:hypothetical protein PR048_007374 [Dryococelus australis]|uniref:Uncharacterized protein n=1 Tax=Dryococelus australis TaxID=614101 RepID=A0ABQ9HUZ9_9NEOP|nr:hypothetical protein PR048_007374 [Dryococelus australis]